MTYESLFVDGGGRTSRRHFIGALVPLLTAFAFYRFAIPNGTANWYVVVLLVPGLVLHARRLHDMGRSAWPLLLPAALVLAAFILIKVGADLALQRTSIVAALAAAFGFMLWGMFGRGEPTPNRYGAPAEA